MSVRVVRLGTPRVPGEGLRIGTGRRPPRGVSRSRLGGWYDVWFPLLAPSAELVRFARSATSERAWAAFRRRYRSEMRSPDASRALDLLAALSRRTDLSVGCYCEDEARCHRSILRALLVERGAEVR
jgi:uncharacterized protein YeaO (DUF488 family)